MIQNNPEASRESSQAEHQWRMPAWKEVHEIFLVDFITSQNLD